MASCLGGKVIVLQNRAPRRFAQPREARRHVQNAGGSFRHGFMIPEVAQKAVFSVAENLMHRRGIRAEGQRAAAHGFKQACRQIVRRGKIDMQR